MANFDRIFVIQSFRFPNRSAHDQQKNHPKKPSPPFIVQTVCRTFYRYSFYVMCAVRTKRIATNFIFLSIRCGAPEISDKSSLISFCRATQKAISICATNFRFARIELFISESTLNDVIHCYGVFLYSAIECHVHWFVWKKQTKNGTQCELVTRRRQLIYTNLHCFWCFWLYHKLHGQRSK